MRTESTAAHVSEHPMTATEIPEGFTPWHGGENPAPGKKVIVVFDNPPTGAMTRTPAPSESFAWSHVKLEKYAGVVVAYLAIE